MHRNKALKIELRKRIVKTYICTKGGCRHIGTISVTHNDATSCTVIADIVALGECFHHCGCSHSHCVSIHYQTLVKPSGGGGGEGKGWPKRSPLRF